MCLLLVIFFCFLSVFTCVYMSLVLSVKWSDISETHIIVLTLKQLLEMWDCRTLNIVRMDRIVQLPNYFLQHPGRWLFTYYKEYFID